MVVTKEQLETYLNVLNGYTKKTYDIASGGNARYYLTEKGSGKELSHYLPKTNLYDCIYAIGKVLENEKRKDK